MIDQLDVFWAGLVYATLIGFRLTRLLTMDDITRGLRARVSGLTDLEHTEWIDQLGQYEEQGVVDPWADDGRVITGTTRAIEAPPIPKWRWELSILIRCPWCAGWWLCLVTALAWALLAGHSPLWALPVGAAASGIVGCVSKVFQ